MRSEKEIIRDVYEQNLRTFSHHDRALARGALRTFMNEIHGAGLRWEFDCYPRNIHKLPTKFARHLKGIKRLKEQSKQFHEFIEALRTLEGREVVEPSGRSTRSRTLSSSAISVYSSFHAAVVAYLDELDKKDPDWATIADRARLAAYIVNGPAWREVGVSVSGEGVCGYDTRRFLEAILVEPK